MEEMTRIMGLIIREPVMLKHCRLFFCIGQGFFFRIIKGLGLGLIPWFPGLPRDDIFWPFRPLILNS